MILKSYIQFINENFHPIDLDDDELMFDLVKAGIQVGDDGELYLRQDADGVNVTINDGLVSRGRLYVDLSDLNSPRMDLDISEMPLDTLEGMPEQVRSFKADHNSFESLDGGPQDVGENYQIYNNKKFISLYGAPLTAWSLEIVNTGLKTCYGIESCSYTMIIFLRNTELTSLKGMPDSVGEGIDITNCTKLESLEGVSDIENGRLHVQGCPIKTLYHARHIDSSKLTIKDGTRIPQVELDYVLGESYTDEERRDNYFENLFIFAKNHKPKELGLIQFPEEFINELSEEDKTLLRSAKGLAKYDL